MYITGYHIEHTGVMHVLIHPDPWSLFIMVTVKWLCLLDWKNWLRVPQNVELLICINTSQSWILISICIKRIPQTKETPVAIYRNVPIKPLFIHMRKHTHTHTHKYMNPVNKSNKIIKFVLHFFRQFSNTLTLSHVQIIFCLCPFHQIP